MMIALFLDRAWAFGNRLRAVLQFARGLARISPSFRFFAFLGWCVFSTLPLSSCADAETHPLALAVASETHGAGLLGEDLPTVPNLISTALAGHEEVAISETWWDSWLLEEVRGAEARHRLYPLVAHRLASDLSPSGIQELLDRAESNIVAVNGVAIYLDPGTIGPALLRARELHGEAADALAGRDFKVALERVLETADALWSLSPQRVAMGLIEEASEAFGRKDSPLSYSEEELIRIRRLIFGANEALEDGDYPRAIRRAYYACQLLGARTL